MGWRKASEHFIILFCLNLVTCFAEKTDISNFLSGRTQCDMRWHDNNESSGKNCAPNDSNLSFSLSGTSKLTCFVSGYTENEKIDF